MKRLMIICEGQTEQLFCARILAPYFEKMEIAIYATSLDGEVSWDNLKKKIEDKLKADKSVFVSTMIDYYGLFSRHHFPKWDLAECITNKENRMDLLEGAMLGDVDRNLQRRFIPYIQLHEFEALLFNDINVFYKQFKPTEIKDADELESTFADFPNPEMINDNKNTSPSHRLSRIIGGYNKLIYGNLIAEAIGIDRMREKAPRFNQWIINIETKINN